MKKFFAAMLILISVSLCACGAAPAADTEPEEEKIEETTDAEGETEEVMLDPTLTADACTLLENDDVTIEFTELRYDEKHQNIWVSFTYAWSEPIDVDIFLENVVVNDSIPLEDTTWNLTDCDSTGISVGLKPITEQGLTTAEKITGTISYQRFNAETLSPEGDKVSVDFELHPYAGK